MLFKSLSNQIPNLVKRAPFEKLLLIQRPFDIMTQTGLSRWGSYNVNRLFITISDNLTNFLFPISFFSLYKLKERKNLNKSVF